MRENKKLRTKSRIAAICILVMTLLISACTKGSDVVTDIDTGNTEATANEEVISQSTYNETDDEAKEVKKDDLTITGNEMYDDQGKREIAFDTLYAESSGVEIWGESDYKCELKTDGTLVRKLLIKNTTDKDAYVELKLDPDKDIKGEVLNYVGSLEYAIHPNGSDGYVEPNSERIVEIDIMPSHFDIQYEGRSELEIDIHSAISVDGSQVERSTIVLNSTVIMYPLDQLSESRFKTATVSGIIHDENGDPIADAYVIARDGYSARDAKAKTDSDGHFELMVNAFKTGYSGSWKEAIIEVKKDGYNARKILIYPKTGKEITVDMSLYPENRLEKYELKSTAEIGLQAYEYGTDHRSIVAFVPFHSFATHDQIKDKIAVTAFDFDGKELFKYPLPYEVPYIFVSDDGEYTVTEVNSSDDLTNATGFKTVILNKSGEEVYAIDHYPVNCNKSGTDEEKANSTISRCAALSHDNRYLVASNAVGNIWLIDWQSNSILWDDFVHAQVRTIDFSKDNQEIYISDGNGYMRCYDLNGNVKWMTDVDSWGTKVRITDEYIVLTVKSAAETLKVLDRKTGELKWSYPTYQTSLAIAVSPDGKYLFYGGHSSNEYSCIANSVFDLETGEIVCPLGPQNAVCGEFSNDGKKLVTLDRKGVRVYDTKDWSYLWGYDIVDENEHSFNFSLVVNDDASKIVATKNTDKSAEYLGQAYFFEYAGYDDNPKYDPNTVTEEENNIGSNDEDFDAQYIFSAFAENRDYSVAGDTKVELDATLKDEFTIDCNYYAVKLTGQVFMEDQMKPAKIIRADKLDISELWIKKGFAYSAPESGYIVFDIEGNPDVMKLPDIPQEDDSEKKSGLYYRLKEDGSGLYIVFYGDKNPPQPKIAE